MPVPHITRANASELARRAAATRKRNVQALKERIVELETKLAAANAERDSLLALSLATAQEPPVLEVDNQRSSVLAQISTLSTRLDSLLADGHPRAVECLARSLGYLREQERILAGRPLPGQFKPKSPAAPNASHFREPPRPISQ